MTIADLFKKKSGETDGPKNAKDPVCGMSVDVEKTKYKSTYQGKTYGFCSENCKKTFDQNPEDYKSS